MVKSKAEFHQLILPHSAARSTDLIEEEDSSGSSAPASPKHAGQLAAAASELEGRFLASSAPLAPSDVARKRKNHRGRDGEKRVPIEGVDYSVPPGRFVDLRDLSSPSDASLAPKRVKGRDGRLDMEAPAPLAQSWSQFVDATQEQPDMVMAQDVPLAETVQGVPPASACAVPQARIMSTNQNIPQISWEEQEEYIPSQEDQAEWINIIESSSPERLSRPPPRLRVNLSSPEGILARKAAAAAMENANLPIDLQHYALPVEVSKEMWKASARTGVEGLRVSASGPDSSTDVYWRDPENVRNALAAAARAGYPPHWIRAPESIPVMYMPLSMALEWGNLGYLLRLDFLADLGLEVPQVRALFPVPWACPEARSDTQAARLRRTFTHCELKFGGQPRDYLGVVPFTTGTAPNAAVLSYFTTLPGPPIDSHSLMQPREGLLKSTPGWETPFVAALPMPLLVLISRTKLDKLAYMLGHDAPAPMGKDYVDICQDYAWYRSVAAALGMAIRPMPRDVPGAHRAIPQATPLRNPVPLFTTLEAAYDYEVARANRAVEGIKKAAVNECEGEELKKMQESFDTTGKEVQDRLRADYEQRADMDKETGLYHRVESGSRVRTVPGWHSLFAYDISAAAKASIPPEGLPLVQFMFGHLTITPDDRELRWIEENMPHIQALTTVERQTIRPNPFALPEHPDFHSAVIRQAPESEEVTEREYLRYVIENEEREGIPPREDEDSDSDSSDDSSIGEDDDTPDGTTDTPALQDYGATKDADQHPETTSGSPVLMDQVTSECSSRALLGVAVQAGNTGACPSQDDFSHLLTQTTVSDTGMDVVATSEGVKVTQEPGTHQSLEAPAPDPIQAAAEALSRALGAHFTPDILAKFKASLGLHARTDTPQLEVSNAPSTVVSAISASETVEMEGQHPSGRELATGDPTPEPPTLAAHQPRGVTFQLDERSYSLHDPTATPYYARRAGQVQQQRLTSTRTAASPALAAGRTPRAHPAPPSANPYSALDAMDEEGDENAPLTTGDIQEDPKGPEQQVQPVAQPPPPLAAATPLTDSWGNAMQEDGPPQPAFPIAEIQERVGRMSLSVPLQNGGFVRGVGAVVSDEVALQIQALLVELAGVDLTNWDQVRHVLRSAADIIRFYVYLDPSASTSRTTSGKRNLCVLAVFVQVIRLCSGASWEEVVEWGQDPDKSRRQFNTSVIAALTDQCNRMGPQHYLHTDLTALLRWLRDPVNKDAVVPADLRADTGLLLHPGYNQGSLAFACYGTDESRATPFLAHSKIPPTSDQSMTIAEIATLLESPGVFFNHYVHGQDAGNHASLAYKGMKLSAQEIQLKVEEAITIPLFRWALQAALGGQMGTLHQMQHRQDLVEGATRPFLATGIVIHGFPRQAVDNINLVISEALHLARKLRLTVEIEPGSIKELMAKTDSATAGFILRVNPPVPVGPEYERAVHSRTEGVYGRVFVPGENRGQGSTTTTTYTTTLVAEEAIAGIIACDPILTIRAASRNPEAMHVIGSVASAHLSRQGLANTAVAGAFQHLFREGKTEYKRKSEIYIYLYPLDPSMDVPNARGSLYRSSKPRQGLLTAMGGLFVEAFTSFIDAANSPAINKGRLISKLHALWEPRRTPSSAK